MTTKGVCYVNDFRVEEFAAVPRTNFQCRKVKIKQREWQWKLLDAQQRTH